MYQKIRNYLLQFYKETEEDISNHYMITMLLVFISFLFTQVIWVLCNPINTANTIITFLTFCIFIAFLYFFKKTSYQLVIKVLFVIVAHICVLVFWLTSEGILGSITSMFPIIIFIVVAIMPLKYIGRILIFTTLLMIFLILIDIYFPQWILPYESLSAKKTDIVFGVIFSSSITGFSFLYLKKQYQEKVSELKRQFDAQKKLNEELDNFVYRTSHDLRAPISSTLGLISLIQMTDNLDEIRSYVNLQEKSMQKMDAFIIEILNYSRNSRMEVVNEEISFQEIYENALAQIAHSKTAQLITTSLEYDKNYVYCSDKLRLQIIFNNIVSNAFRYLDSQKATSFLEISISHTQSEITIRFKDNGLGIQKDSIPKVFDMFYRAHKHSAGSGVGLYIVKQSIEKMGGKIFCYSEEKVGTTFEVRLLNKCEI